MLFQDIVMLAATQNGISGGGDGPADLWPFSGMGVEADWTFSSGAFGWQSDGVALAAAGATDTAVLALAAAAVFDLSVPNSTACTVTFDAPFGGEAGFIEVRMKGGSWVEVEFDGSAQQVPVSCTSGTGSGFELRGTVAGSGENNIQDITIFAV